MKKRDILFLSSSATIDIAVLLSGIAELRDKHGWSVHIIGDIDSRKTLLKLLEFWNPDGCIVHCALDDKAFNAADFAGMPTVWLDRDPATLPPGALCVMQDARSVGTIAAKELLRYDLASYAFVDRADAPFWSKGRREAFKEAVELNRSPYFEFCEKGASSWAKRLSGFIRSLSRPAGVFCANDTVAADVISVASRAGIAIPEELLVVGVDDVEAYCEALSPTLTSVRPSFAEEGRGAADLLAERLANPRLKGVVKTFSAHEITLRQSTRRISANGGNIGAGGRWSDGRRSRKTDEVFPPFWGDSFQAVSPLVHSRRNTFSANRTREETDFRRRRTDWRVAPSLWFLFSCDIPPRIQVVYWRLAAGL